MLFASIKDGVFPVFTGLLMKTISPDMLFYSMAFMNSGLIFLLWKTIQSLKNDGEQSENRENLLEMNTMKKGSN